MVKRQDCPPSLVKLGYFNIIMNCRCEVTISAVECWVRNDWPGHMFCCLSNVNLEAHPIVNLIKVSPLDDCTGTFWQNLPTQLRTTICIYIYTYCDFTCLISIQELTARIKCFFGQVPNLTNGKSTIVSMRTIVCDDYQNTIIDSLSWLIFMR